MHQLDTNTVVPPYPRVICSKTTADSSEPYIKKRRVNFRSTKVGAGKLKRKY
jgi:hypothetical protein